MIGLEVERVEDKGKKLAPYVIAKVVDAKQHPNADRLRVCMVEPATACPPGRLRRAQRALPA